MRITEEEKAGAKVSLTILLIGVFASTVLLTAIAGDVMVLIFFPFDYSFLVLLIGAAFWGSKAGIQIIRQNKHEDLAGIKAAFLVMLSFVASRIPLDMDVKNAFYDMWSFRKFLSGLLTIVSILTIPTIIYGILLGRRLKKHGY